MYDFSVAKQPEEVDVAVDNMPKEASLLGLPAELRNRIYELVFGGKVVHICARRRKPRVAGDTDLLDITKYIVSLHIASL